MPFELTVCARYNETADRAFARARSFTDMIRASRPLTFYRGLPRGDMEEGATYTTDISVLGLFKLDAFRIQIDRLDNDSRVMQSRESNAKLRVWNHELTVEPLARGCIWTDRVVIDAGAASGFVTCFARIMYTVRHLSRRAHLAGSEVRRI
ncbi:MAG: hypothetical protein ACWA5A_17620 [Marinibacterium sp.]